MRKYQVCFDQLPINSEFGRNGNRWLKVSTRTAKIIKPVEYSGQWFYFRNDDQCVITSGGAK